MESSTYKNKLSLGTKNKERKKKHNLPYENRIKECFKSRKQNSQIKKSQEYEVNQTHTSIKKKNVSKNKHLECRETDSEDEHKVYLLQ